MLSAIQTHLIGVINPEPEFSVVSQPGLVNYLHQERLQRDSERGLQSTQESNFRH